MYAPGAHLRKGALRPRYCEDDDDDDDGDDYGIRVCLWWVSCSHRKSVKFALLTVQVVSRLCFVQSLLRQERLSPTHAAEAENYVFVA